MIDGSVAAVILAGGIRRSSLHRQTGVHPLHLPLLDDKTTLECWVESVRSAFGNVPVSVVGDGSIDTDNCRTSLVDGVMFRDDPRPHRGTAGVLADLFRSQEGQVRPDLRWLCVIDGSSCPPENLEPIREQKRKIVI